MGMVCLPHLQQLRGPPWPVPPLPSDRAQAILKLTVQPQMTSNF